jgi:anthranilate synthase component 1
MEELPPLQGGLMGFLGYDIVREVEDLPNTPRDDRKLPDATICMIGSLAAFDHWRQRVYMLESVPLIDLDNLEIDAAYDAAIERIRQAVADLTKPLTYVAVEPPRADDYKSQFDSTKNGNSYQRAVLAAKEYIKAGDIFQVVLSQRFDVQLNADPFDVYRVLRQVNPSPYMYYVKHPELTIVGSSPEPMMKSTIASWQRS